MYKNNDEEEERRCRNTERDVGQRDWKMNKKAEEEKNTYKANQ